MSERAHESMTEARAREVLGRWIGADGRLHFSMWNLSVCCDHFVGPDDSPVEATLSGRFTADQLEAIAFWIRQDWGAQ